MKQVAVVDQETQSFLRWERNGKSLHRTGGKSVTHLEVGDYSYHYLVQSPGDLQVSSPTLVCLSLQVDSQGGHLLCNQVQALLCLWNNHK